MKKDQIQTRRGLPALDVKARNFARGLDVETEFGCDTQTAEKALQFAFEAQKRSFWEDVVELAHRYLGRRPSLQVWQEGRCGGWLVVSGLTEVKRWDMVDVSRWSHFARAVERDVAYRCAADTIREDIKANRWAEPGSEEFNFIDRTGGSSACLVDLKRQKAKAEFAQWNKPQPQPQSAFAKIGTGPQECVDVRGEEKIGAAIEFRRMADGERWQPARITAIEDGRLYLALE